VRRNHRLLAALPLEMNIRTAERKQCAFEGREASGWLQATLTVDLEAKLFTFFFKTREKPALPATVLPLLRWLSQMRAPNEVVLRSPLWGKPAATPLRGGPSLDEGYVRMVEALDDVQHRSGAFFDLPVDLAEAEVGYILSARTLLSGGELRARWTAPLRVSRAILDDQRLLPILNSGQAGCLIVEQEEEVKIRGHRIPLGRVRTLFESVRLAGAPGAAPSIRDALEVVDLAPGTNDRLRRRRHAESGSRTALQRRMPATPPDER